MKLALSFFLITLIGQAATVFCIQFSGHKSEAEIARMTPEQHVKEHCREYVRHGLVDSDYGDLIERYLYRDGLKAVPYLAMIIDEYDPTRAIAKSHEMAQRAYACTTFLPQLDANVVRLRASVEGKKVIEAMRKLLERMRAAHFDTDEIYDRRNTYEILVAGLKEVEGINYCDEAIRSTLKLRYHISLSDKELLDFTNHLMSKDPYYPSWSDREEYKDLTQRNEAGNPIWYVIMKKPERFYEAYLQYKAKSAR
jgi:hypothetical protein